MHRALCYFDFYLVKLISLANAQGVRLPQESLLPLHKPQPFPFFASVSVLFLLQSIFSVFQCRMSGFVVILILFGEWTV